MTDPVITQLSPTFNPVNSVPQLTGFDPSKYQKTAQAFARILTGSGRMKIACVGDSTTAGFNATTGDSGYTNMQPNCWPTRAAKLMNASGIPAEVCGAMGWNSAAAIAAHVGYDPRITLGTNWTTGSTVCQGGETYFIPNSGGVAALGFTPGVAFDHLRIWNTVAGSPNGSCTVNISGGSSLGTINTNGGLAFGHTDFTASGTSSDIINIVPSNDGQLNIIGIEQWNAASPKVQFFNFGVSAAHVADKLLATNIFWPLPSIASLSAVEVFDLAIICLDVNDSNQSTGVGTYQANLLTLVKAWQAAGSEVLIVGGPPSSGFEALRPVYVQAEQAVAALTNCAFLDLAARWGTFASAPSGRYSADGIHPLAAGYSAMAQAIVSTLLQLAQ